MKTSPLALGVMRAHLISPAQQPSGPVVARKLEGWKILEQGRASLLVTVHMSQEGSSEDLPWSLWSLGCYCFVIVVASGCVSESWLRMLIAV